LAWRWPPSGCRSAPRSCSGSPRLHGVITCAPPVGAGAQAPKRAPSPLSAAGRGLRTASAGGSQA
jgi:hypothetical protein